MKLELILKIGCVVLLTAYLTAIGMLIHGAFGTNGSVMMIACYLVFIYKFIKKPIQ
jgi:hypothetical protein